MNLRARSESRFEATFAISRRDSERAFLLNTDSRIDLKIKSANCSCKFDFQSRSLGFERFAFFLNRFEPRFLVVRFGDVTSNQRFGFGRFRL